MIALNENLGGRATSLADIEQLTQTLAQEHGRLTELLQEFDAAMAQLRHHYAPQLRARVAAVTRARLGVHTAITAAPGLFEKPRTQVFHGIKVGLQKGRGGIEFADAEKVLALIRKNFGAGAPAYIRTTEAPDKKMLAELSVAELKKLGCTVADTGDVVVIKPADPEMERAATALLSAPASPCAR